MIIYLQAKIDALAFKPHTVTSIPTIVELHSGPRSITHNRHTIEPNDIASNSTSLHISIIDSTDKLFFISYTPSGTMMRRWFIIQVDIDASKSLEPDFVATGIYYCVFLAKHPGNKKIID